jgi:hypothetical protein
MASMCGTQKAAEPPDVVAGVQQFGKVDKVSVPVVVLCPCCMWSSAMWSLLIKSDVLLGMWHMGQQLHPSHVCEQCYSIQCNGVTGGKLWGWAWLSYGLVLEAAAVIQSFTAGPQ